jgi:leucyl aminopeptidase
MLSRFYALSPMGEGREELRVTDQTALSFASKSAPADGVAVVFAEEGRKLTPTALDLDKKAKGLLSKAADITGFKGKKEQTVDLIAPQGLKFARVAVVGTDKPGSYSAEDWLNLGGVVRGLLSGKEAPAAHIFLETSGGEIAPADIASFALGAMLRGYKFKKYKTKSRKKNGATNEADAQEDRHSLRRP